MLISTLRHERRYSAYCCSGLADSMPLLLLLLLYTRQNDGTPRTVVRAGGFAAAAAAAAADVLHKDTIGGTPRTVDRVEAGLADY